MSPSVSVRILLCPVLLPAAPLLAADSAPAPVELSFMNPKAPPCTDFYTFANGAYDAVEIPADYASYGINEELDNRNFAILHEILEQAGKTRGAEGSAAQRLGDFYASGMDEAAIAKAGLTPLQGILDEIDALPTADALPAMFGRLYAMGIDTALGFSVTIDDKDSTRMITRLSQGGYGLPERNYYFDATPEAEKIRDAYLAHIEKMLVLAGAKAAEAHPTAAAIMALEKSLAEASRTLEQLRDPQANYHKFKRANLDREVAPFAWSQFFAAVQLPEGETDVVVGQPEFFPRLAELVRSTPLATWRAYLRWQVLDQTASVLSPAFEEENFAFGGRILSGAKQLKPRWKRVLAVIDGLMGEDLGQLYVQRAFSPEAKARALEMVRFVLAAMRIRIAQVPWMAESTKQSALHKIDTLRVKIGYPDVWRDYRALKISRQPYVRNVLAGRAFEFHRQMAKLGRPVDRNEWQMTPQTNNAYYDPTLNEICFPAGILQPPFFDEKADAAGNYGSIGPTIGHELTHAFDDSGRQYDADGNLRDWWTPEDAARFDERAEFIAKQYDQYEPVPGLKINGHQTLGENIADIGGLLVAYDALQLATVGASHEPIDGFTPEQRFFIAFGQSWRTNDRPERRRFITTSDVHSPARWRVIGSVANCAPFYQAFGCPMPANLPPSIW